MAALRRWSAAALAALGLLLAASAAYGQDDGPRVYQLAPEGFQTFTAFLVNKRGNEGPDPGQTSPGSETRTDILVLRYAGTFSWAGRQFTPFAILPIGQLKVTQGVGEGDKSSGIGDAQLGGTVGLLGSPALSTEDYAAFRPMLSASLLGRVFFPTGDYSGERPVNLGANRFSYQLGLPTTFMFGQSYRDPRLTALEVFPTVTFYSPNSEPFVGDRRTQAPLFSVEAHLTHNLPDRIWLSADLIYRDGGESQTDGVDNHDPVHGWSAGASAAFPFVGPTSLIFTYQHVVKRWDLGPDGWFFRTALVAPF
ncbi:MAG TPA: transporter [Phenylobacterium sp.]